MAESPRSRAGMPSVRTASTDGTARTESTKKDGNTTTTSVTYGNQPVKKGNRLVTSAEDMKSWWQNPDGSYTEFGQNTVEPYVDTSKKMAEGMTEPLGAGDKDLKESLNSAVSNLIDNPNYQTAGYGGLDPSLTDGDKGGGSGGDSGGDKDPGSAAGDLAAANPKETNRYTNSMMGIWDAFREGKIDKGTALYFTLDSIAKLARNTGKDLNNIAAAFTGGTIDNEREDSLWSQRRNKMFENELAGEVESQYGSPAWRSKQHDLNSLSMEDKDLFAKDISNWIADNSKGLTVNELAEQLRAMGISNDITEAMNWLKIDLGNKAKAGDKNAAAILSTLDGLNTVSTPLTNAATTKSLL